MNRKRILKTVLPALLVLLAAIAFSVVALASESRDYSRPGSDHNKTFGSADILEYLLGEQLCTAEREYLAVFGGEDIIYDDGITTEPISVLYDADRASLSVYAKPYSYISADGSEIIWTPDTATLEGVTLALTKIQDGSYTASFIDITDTSDSAAVKINYTLDLVITKDAANALLNKAYNDAPLIEAEFEERTAEYIAAKEHYDAYLVNIADYNEKKVLYEEYRIEYLEYSEALERYNEYLADLAAYEAQKAAYEKYLVDMEQYDKDLSAYATYLNEYKLYSAALSEYNAYMEAVTPLRNQLAAIELAEIKMTSLKRSARAAINGNLVDSVLAQRDSLESPMVNAPEKVIDMAGDATERLRVLMDDYFALKTEASRYAYYATYYEEFRDNFVNLFISLDYLYTNGTIRAYIYETDREEKYRILLVQLYLIATALSDAPVKSVDPALVTGTNGAETYKQTTYTEKYRTADGYYLSEILENTVYITDTDSASPYDTGFPAEVSEPVAPAEIKEPTMPTQVSKPSSVTPVDPPGDEPTRVADPGEAPETVVNPGEAPALSETEEKLIAAYYADELSKSQLEFTSDVVYAVKKAVDKRFINVDTATVTFFDTDGNECYSVIVDSGTAADYGGAVPVKAEDSRAVYVFAGWQDGHGNPISLDSVIGDLRLYPRFDEIIKNYTVRWNVDGRVTESILPYGALPHYDGSTEKPETSVYKYSFIGWDQTVTAVSCDVTYTALFDESYIVPASEGGARLGYDGNYYTLDFTAFYDTSYSLTEIITRANGKGGVRLYTRYATLVLGFGAVKTLYALDASSLSISFAEALGANEYTVTVCGKDGAPISTDARISVVAGTDMVYSDRLKLFSLDETGEREYTKYSLNGTSLSFTAVSGKKYTLAYEYTLIAASSSLVKITSPGLLFSAGASVGVDISLADGVRLTRLYYKDSDGNETDLDGSRFVMPDKDITLIAEVDYIKYRVSFVSDGKVITSSYYKAGETPIPPEDPKKVSDSEFSYIFSGWSPEISPANESVTYTAVITALPLSEKADSGTAMTVYQKVVFAAVIAALALLLVTVALIARAVHKRFYF